MAAVLSSSSSSVVVSSGGDTKDAFSQMTFASSWHCKLFSPHPHKANICINCMKLINLHTRTSIANPDMVIAALEFSQHGTATPSLIIDKSTDTIPLASVYLGGYAGVCNTKWMIESKVSHVLCCAQGLSMVS
jgi:hypothetical protein